LSLLAKKDRKESEIRELFRANEQFIKDLQPFEAGGNYSQEEIAW